MAAIDSTGEIMKKLCVFKSQKINLFIAKRL